MKVKNSTKVANRMDIRPDDPKFGTPVGSVLQIRIRGFLTPWIRDEFFRI
jgi:hypothetical protein